MQQVLELKWLFYAWCKKNIWNIAKPSFIYKVLPVHVAPYHAQSWLIDRNIILLPLIEYLNSGRERRVSIDITRVTHFSRRPRAVRKGRPPVPRLPAADNWLLKRSRRYGSG